jgi:hypothetical protein
MKNYVVFGLLLFFLSGIYKFYTIPLLILMLLIVPRLRHKILTVFLFLIACFSAIRDLSLMQEPIPSSGYAQFGFTVYSKYLQQVGLTLPLFFEYLISAGVFAISILAMYFLGRKSKAFTRTKFPDNTFIFVVLASVFVSCYFAGLSYDPRLIYLTLAGVFLVVFFERSSFRSIILVLVGWSSLFSCGIELGFIPKEETGFHLLRLVQLSNDLSISLVTSVFVLTLVRVCFFQTKVLISRDKNGATLE